MAKDPLTPKDDDSYNSPSHGSGSGSSVGGRPTTKEFLGTFDADGMWQKVKSSSEGTISLEASIIEELRTVGQNLMKMINHVYVAGQDVLGKDYIDAIYENKYISLFRKLVERNFDTAFESFRDVEPSLYEDRGEGEFRTPGLDSCYKQEKDREKKQKYLKELVGYVASRVHEVYPVPNVRAIWEYIVTQLGDDDTPTKKKCEEYKKTIKDADSREIAARIAKESSIDLPNEVVERRKYRQLDQLVKDITMTINQAYENANLPEEMVREYVVSKIGENPSDKECGEHLKRVHYGGRAPVLLSVREYLGGLYDFYRIKPSAIDTVRDSVVKLAKDYLTSKRKGAKSTDKLKLFRKFRNILLKEDKDLYKDFTALQDKKNKLDEAKKSSRTQLIAPEMQLLDNPFEALLFYNGFVSEVLDAVAKFGDKGPLAQQKDELMRLMRENCPPSCFEVDDSKGDEERFADVIGKIRSYLGQYLGQQKGQQEEQKEKTEDKNFRKQIGQKLGIGDIPPEELIRRAGSLEAFRQSVYQAVDAKDSADIKEVIKQLMENKRALENLILAIEQ